MLLAVKHALLRHIGGVARTHLVGFRLADGEVVEAQQFMEEGQSGVGVTDDRLLGLLLLDNSVKELGVGHCGCGHLVAGRLVGFQLAKKVNQFLF
jgi:hypothetical protein